MGRSKHRPDAVRRASPVQTGAYRACHRAGAPGGRRIVPIAGNGNCLYHAVAYSVLRHRSTPTANRRVAVGALSWLTGHYAHTPAGAYAARGQGLRGALHRALRQREQRPKGREMARAMQHAYRHVDRAADGAREYAGALRRTRTRKAWGELAEIVALAMLLGTSITVFQCQPGAPDRWVTWTFRVDGACSLRPARSRTAPPASAVELLNCEGHFEPLVPCG